MEIDQLYIMCTLVNHNSYKLDTLLNDYVDIAN